MRLVIVIAVFVTSAQGLGAKGPEQAPGFPVLLSGPNTASGLLAHDFLGAGRPQIVAVNGPGVALVRADGSIVQGFPVELKDPTTPTRVVIETSPSACDVDGDGKPEIIVASSNQRVWALRPTGELTPGYPVVLDGAPKGPLGCVGGELILTTNTGSLTAIRNGKARVIANLGRGTESGVAVADVNGDGAIDYVVGGGDAQLHVLDDKGRPHKGFPYKMSYRISGVPALGDINDDGRVDIIVGSQDFSIHAVGLDGQALPGFPVKTGYRIYAGVALADLDGNGVLDVVTGSGDSKFYAVDGNGKAIDGFPLTADGRVVADAVVGDIDRDGHHEVAFVTQGGSLYVVNHRGKNLKGFPTPLGGKAQTAPTLADLDGDDVPEVIAHSPTGRLVAYTFKKQGKAERALVAWATVGHSPTRSGRFGPNPGRFKELSFASLTPATTDALKVQYTFFDLDGEAERDTQIRWFKNGKHVAELDNAREVSPDKTRKHERWRYTLQEGQNFSSYGAEGTLSRIFTSQEVRILNTPPAAPKISLTPGEPFTTDTLTMSVTSPSADPDGDTIEYRHVWSKDDSVQKLPPSTTRIDGARTKKNETWKVMVIPFDGEVEGAITSAQVFIKNTKPTAPQVVAVPATPGINDVVTFRIQTPGHDADGDRLVYTYDTWVDGKLLNLDRSLDTIAPRILRKHQKVKTRITTVDDQEPGGSVETELVVQNTPPPTPKVTIWPPRPRTKDDLHFMVVAQEEDADQDTIVYRHRWTLDGKAQEHPTVIAHALTKRGQTWELTVTPFDGEVEGKPVVVKTVVENSPPTAPLAMLSTYATTADVDIASSIILPSTDDDGDPVTLRYAWSKGGQPAPAPHTEPTLPAAKTRKGDVWTLTITPHDGLVDGPSVSLEARIKNSPPPAPVVRISNSEPTVRDEVVVTVVSQPKDLDGDAISYRYRWYRDGKPVRGWATTKDRLLPGEGRAGQHWRVDVHPFDGDDEGALASGSLRIVNHAPEPPKVSVAPEKPHTDDTLRCVAQGAQDPDGDTLQLRTRWLLDGKPIALDPDQNTLPPSYTLRGQRWSCEVESFDGVLTSAPVRSAVVTIVNSPPSAIGVRVTPKLPSTTDDLLCQLTRAATDPDLNLVTYRYAWTVDNKPYSGKLEDPQRVPASVTRRGQVWQCTVTPYDDQGPGPSARASVTVQNSPPSRPIVQITPSRPRAGKPLRCIVATSSSDLDGDKVDYRFVWLKDGVQQAFAPTSTEVPARLIKARDMWRCQVTPHDGQADGPVGVTTDIVVAN